MAHYAFITDGIVTEVITGIDETELIEGLEPETWYGNLRGQICKRTSYNNKIHGTYAGIGFTYNQSEDIFIAPQPYPSWIRSGSYWNSPTPRPEDGQFYSWNEATLSWDVLDETTPE
jgi:hypothetical protein